MLNKTIAIVCLGLFGCNEARTVRIELHPSVEDLRPNGTPFTSSSQSLLRGTHWLESLRTLEINVSTDLKGILTYNDAPLVSIDFNHDPASSAFDATQTQVIDGRFVRILSWYDNEWGFSNRMADTAVKLGKL